MVPPFEQDSKKRVNRVIVNLGIVLRGIKELLSIG